MSDVAAAAKAAAAPAHSAAGGASAAGAASSRKAADVAKRRAKLDALRTRALQLLPPSAAGLCTVAVDKRGGRSVVAESDLAAGTPILAEHAFGWALRAEKAGRGIGALIQGGEVHCAHCARPCPPTSTTAAAEERESKPAVADAAAPAPAPASAKEGMVRCESCAETYCSATCQAASAAMHRFECALLPSLQSLAAQCSCDPDLLRLIVSVLAQRFSQSLRPDGADGAVAAAQEQGCTLGRWEHVTDLVAHLDRAGAEWTAAVSAGMTALRDEYVKQAEKMGIEHTMHLLPSVSEMVALCARLNNNSHSLFDNYLGSNSVVGMGLWPATSMLNGSCYPNCFFSAQGEQGRMVVRTIRPVKAGEELTVPYSDLYQPRLDRQLELIRDKNYVCACERCVAEERSKMPTSEALAAPVAPDTAITPARLHAWLQVGGVYCPRCKEARAQAALDLWDDATKKGKKKKKKAPAATTAAAAAPDASSSTDVSFFPLPALQPDLGLLVWRGRGSDAATFTAAAAAGESAADTGAADWVCTRSSCGARLRLSEVDSLLSPLHSLYEQSLRLKESRSFEATVVCLDKLLDQAADLVPPLHALNMLTLTPLLNVCRARGMLTRSELALLRIIRSMECVFPTNLPEISDFWVALAELRLEAIEAAARGGMSDDQRAACEAGVRDAYAHAFVIRRVACGDDHPRTLSIPHEYRREPDANSNPFVAVI